MDSHNRSRVPTTPTIQASSLPSLCFVVFLDLFGPAGPTLAPDKREESGIMAKEKPKPLHPKSIASLPPGNHPDGDEGGCPGPHASRQTERREGLGGPLRAQRRPGDPRACRRPSGLPGPRGGAEGGKEEAHRDSGDRRDEFRRRIETARRAKSADKLAPTFGRWREPARGGGPQTIDALPMGERAQGFDRTPAGEPEARRTFEG